MNIFGALLTDLEQKVWFLADYFGKSKYTILYITSHTTIVQIVAVIARSTAEISRGALMPPQFFQLPK